jgi:hypothetical protein
VVRIAESVTGLGCLILSLPAHTRFVVVSGNDAVCASLGRAEEVRCL